jgi:hypothetical protein
VWIPLIELSELTVRLSARRKGFPLPFLAARFMRLKFVRNDWKALVSGAANDWQMGSTCATYSARVDAA